MTAHRAEWLPPPPDKMRRPRLLPPALQLASVLVICLTPWAFEFVTSGMSVVIVTVPEKDSNRASPALCKRVSSKRGSPILNRPFSTDGLSQTNCFNPEFSHTLSLFMPQKVLKLALSLRIITPYT